MSSEFHIRIRRVATPAAGQSHIVQTDSIDYAAVYSDIPTLSFEASQVVNGALTEGTELAVEFWNGTVWAEPEQGRFIVQDADFDEIDPTLMTRVTCLGWVPYLLARAVLNSADGSEREYHDTAGLIIFHPLEEAKGRGWGTNLTYRFNALTDSNGRPWSGSAQRAHLNLPADQTALAILQTLATQQLIEWTTRGRELVVVNPGTGVDQTLVNKPVYVGRQALELPVRHSIGDAATSVVMRDDEGRATRHDGGDILGLGVLEKAVSASGVTDAATVAVLGDLAKNEGRPQTQFTVTENLAALDAAALIDYALGDYVNVRRRLTGTWERMRAMEVQVRQGNDRTVSLDVVLQDRLTDLTARLAKRAASLGASLGGSGFYKSRNTGASGAAQVGTIDPAHLGTGPARVMLNGELTDPLPFLAGYRPYPGDTVEIISAGALGLIIQGRIVNAALPETAGTSEPIELDNDWKAYDAGRYGEPTIRRMGSDWVILSGMVVRQGNASDRILTLPGSYRPNRTRMAYPAATGDDAGTSGTYAGGAYLTLDGTGALRFGGPFPPEVGAIVSLAGVMFNVQENIVITNPERPVGYGKDTNGTVFTFGFEERLNANLEIGLSAGFRPDRDRRIAGVGEGYNGSASYWGTVTAAGLAYLTAPYTTYLDGAHWQADDGNARYSWETLGLINGFEHVPGDPVQFTKTPDGITMLRGSHTAGVWGQSMGQLPAGCRPSFELVTKQDVRITAGGNLISATPVGVGALNTMFVPGR